jgi:hypothetical protein
VLAPKPWASARAQVPGASVQQSQRHPMQCHYIMPSLPADSIPIHAAENLDPSDQATFLRHLTLEVFSFRAGSDYPPGVSEMDGSSGGRLSREN